MKLSKMKTLLTATTVLCILASTSIAAPLYDTTTSIGASQCHPVQNFRYTVAFDNPFGGHWNLTGHSQSNRDGTYTDSFSGTTDTLQDSLSTGHDEWLYWVHLTFARCFGEAGLVIDLFIGQVIGEAGRGRKLIRSEGR